MVLDALNMVWFAHARGLPLQAQAVAEWQNHCNRVAHLPLRHDVIFNSWIVLDEQHRCCRVQELRTVQETWNFDGNTQIVSRHSEHS